MARKRKVVSKRLRFEIFKRDGFRCIYCGRDPTQEPLHVDHVVAVASGGGNEPENLVTSCGECNLGKGAVPLSQKRLAVVGTEAQLEQPEQILAYLELQRQLNAAKREAANQLANYWEEHVGPMTQDMSNRLVPIVNEWPHAKLVEAIHITAGRLGCPGSEFHLYTATQQAKYFHGILRRWRGLAEGGK